MKTVRKLIFPMIQILVVLNIVNQEASNGTIHNLKTKRMKKMKEEKGKEEVIVHLLDELKI